MNSFEITQAHLMLLKELRIRWQDEGDYGGPCVDHMTPYGTSGLGTDIASILEWAVEFKSCKAELTEDQEKLVFKLHREMEQALQICIQLGKFEVGIYKVNQTGKWEIIPTRTILRCPECKGHRVNQYRKITGPIWCDDCGFRVEHKENSTVFLSTVYLEIPEVPG